MLLDVAHPGADVLERLFILSIVQSVRTPRMSQLVREGTTLEMVRKYEMTTFDEQQNN